MTRVVMVVSGVVSEGAGSGGGTGGAVLRKSTRATRATPPARPWSTPATSPQTRLEAGSQGHTAPGIPLPRMLSGQARNACVGLGHIRGMYVPV